MRTPQGDIEADAAVMAMGAANAGHGALGWTLSSGCAKVVSDLVSGAAPPIALEGLTLSS